MQTQTTFGMYEILAILGALAWLPQVFIWIRNSLAKTKMTIISDKEFEIGYTSFGPILNVRLAFLAEGKKALIRTVELELTHEKNDTQKFSWDWFEETLYELNVPNTGLLPTKKIKRQLQSTLTKTNSLRKKLVFSKTLLSQNTSDFYKPRQKSF